jgi:hypothetical protein
MRNKSRENSKNAMRKFKTRAFNPPHWNVSGLQSWSLTNPETVHKREAQT